MQAGSSSGRSSYKQSAYAKTNKVNNTTKKLNAMAVNYKSRATVKFEDSDSNDDGRDDDTELKPGGSKINLLKSYNDEL